ncbi:MAG: response regulator, partial [bacterium]|nr:response regulator [bacterium]
INVYSEPGEGTTFTLYFPVSEKEITDVVDVRQVYEGDATILVVDDEENVRQYAEKILKKLGHTVLLAKDGKEAVKIYKQKKDEIDLVLLDMIMPKMDGKETNLALRKTNPDVRILLASGYSQNGSATEILNEGAIGFIQKPFRADELSKAIVVALKQ